MRCSYTPCSLAAFSSLVQRCAQEVLRLFLLVLVMLHQTRAYITLKQYMGEEDEIIMISRCGLHTYHTCNLQRGFLIVPVSGFIQPIRSIWSYDTWIWLSILILTLKYFPSSIVQLFGEWQGGSTSSSCSEPYCNDNSPCRGTHPIVSPAGSARPETSPSRCRTKLVDSMTDARRHTLDERNRSLAAWKSSSLDHWLPVHSNRARVC